MITYTSKRDLENQIINLENKANKLETLISITGELINGDNSTENAIALQAVCSAIRAICTTIQKNFSED